MAAKQKPCSEEQGLPVSKLRIRSRRSKGNRRCEVTTVMGESAALLRSCADSLRQQGSACGAAYAGETSLLPVIRPERRRVTVRCDKPTNRYWWRRYALALPDSTDCGTFSFCFGASSRVEFRMNVSSDAT